MEFRRLSGDHEHSLRHFIQCWRPSQTSAVDNDKDPGDRFGPRARVEDIQLCDWSACCKTSNRDGGYPIMVVSNSVLDKD